MEPLTGSALSREPPPPRKKQSIFGWVLKVVGVVLAGFLVAGIWLIATSPTLERVLRAMSEQRHLMQEEMTAPGAREIAKAGQCQQVLVMSPEIRKKIRARRRRSRGSEPPADETMVMCVAPMFREPPECDVIAREYVDAAHPTGSFRIEVSKAVRAKTGCSVDYDSSGTPIVDGGI